MNAYHWEHLGNTISFFTLAVFDVICRWSDARRGMLPAHGGSITSADATFIPFLTHLCHSAKQSNYDMCVCYVSQSSVQIGH